VLKIILSAGFNHNGVLSFQENKPLTSSHKQMLRTCLSAKGTIPNWTDTGIPSDIFVPITGLYNAQTIGWSYESGTTRWVLLSATVIVVATIAVTLTAIMAHRGVIPTQSVSQCVHQCSETECNIDVQVDGYMLNQG
jgi:hypothetical protein